MQVCARESQSLHNLLSYELSRGSTNFFLVTLTFKTGQANHQGKSIRGEANEDQFQECSDIGRKIPVTRRTAFCRWCFLERKREESRHDTILLQLMANILLFLFKGPKSIQKLLKRCLMSCNLREAHRNTFLGCRGRRSSSHFGGMLGGR